MALVGGGNSAGQAAVYLASQVAKVWLLVRGAGLEASMSRYLVDRIAGLPNVEVLTADASHRARGHATACWRRSAGAHGARRGDAAPIRHLFLFIGADPNTAWLAGSGVALDAQGLRAHRRGRRRRRARPLETSRPGVFAIGDVRAGSIKRVAAAVGEGAQVVAALHAYLAETDAQPAIAAMP